MKRMLVLALGLTLIAAASVGTAAAQHQSGNPQIDSTWDWPIHCKKKALPDHASEIAKSRIADRLCRPVPPPIPCLPVPCDPPPDPCRVLEFDEFLLRCPIPPPPCLDRPDVSAPNDDLARLRWWPCLPPPCPVPLDLAATSGGVAGMTYWPCPIPPPIPCPLPYSQADALTWAPCPIPPPLPCPIPADGALSKCPIPPEPCAGMTSSSDYWRCPDDKPRPLPTPIPLPDPLPKPLPLPAPVLGDFEAKV